MAGDDLYDQLAKLGGEQQAPSAAAQRFRISEPRSSAAQNDGAPSIWNIASESGRRGVNPAQGGGGYSPWEMVDCEIHFESYTLPTFS